jgi:hypothetical protein
VLGFVPRSQLVQLVPHIGEIITVMSYLLGWWGGRKCRQSIGDRQFVSFLQFYLHKFGEIALGNLHIKSSTNGNGSIVIANGKDRELPLAVVPIPNNVTNFESILIRFAFAKKFLYKLDLLILSTFDESVIAFLQKFQQNSLLDNVNLYFNNCSDILLQIVANFLPLFANINSITIGNPDVLDELQCEYSELAIPLTSARILIV